MCVLLIVFIIFANPNRQGKTVGNIVIPVFSGGSISTVLCGNTSTLLTATSTSRQYLSVGNESGTNIFLSFGKQAALYQGVMITASSTMNFGQDTLFGGAIYCIAQSNASTSIQEIK